MIDQLNTSNIQKLSAELASGRLESLLRIGQTQLAKVVEVTPQPSRPNQVQANPTSNPSSASTNTAAPNPGTSTALVSNSGQASTNNSPPSNQAATAKVQAVANSNTQTLLNIGLGTASKSNTVNPAITAKANSGNTFRASTASTNTSSAKTSNGSAGRVALQTQGGAAENLGYRTKLNIQGRLIEIVVPRPLVPGSQVQISRDANNNISLQVSPSSQPATKPVGPLKSAAPTPDSKTPGQARTSSPVPNNPLATKTSANTLISEMRIGERIPARVVEVSPERTSHSAAQKNNSTSTLQTANTRQIPGTVLNASSQPRAGSLATSAQPQAAPSSAHAANPSTLVTSRAAFVANNTLAQPTNPTPQQATAQQSSQPVAQSPVQQQSAAPQPSSPAAPTANQTAATTASSYNTGPHRITLEVQGRLVEVSSPQAIRLGTDVGLRLTPNGKLTLELPAPKTDASAAALRQHLPIQQPPHHLLNLVADPQNMAQLTKGQPLLQSLIQILMSRSLSTPQNTNADGVKQQLNSSGVQLENRLAQGDTRNLQQDQKALLLRLNQALTTTNPKQMPQPLGQQATQLAQQAISRIVFNQVSSLLQHQQEGSNEQIRHLAFDIPVNWQGRSESIQLRIDHQDDSAKADGEQGKQRWKVQLRFDMDDLPSMGAELTLEAQGISVIWYGDNNVRQLLAPNLDKLQLQLEQAGLEVQALGVRDKPPVDSDIPRLKRQLIDIRT